LEGILKIWKIDHLAHSRIIWVLFVTVDRSKYSCKEKKNSVEVWYAFPSSRNCQFSQFL